MMFAKEELLKIQTLGYIPADVLEDTAKKLLDEAEAMLGCNFADCLDISDSINSSKAGQLYDSVYEKFDSLEWFKDLVCVMVRRDKLETIRTREQITHENKMREMDGHPPLEFPEFKFSVRLFYPGNVKLTAVLIDGLTADCNGHVKYGERREGDERVATRLDHSLRPLLEPLITKDFEWPKRKIANKLCKALNQILEL